MSSVPDGDRDQHGHDRENGAKEVSDKSASTVGEAAGIFAKGLSVGARGNSRVITLAFAVFSKCEEHEELTGEDLALAFSLV